MAKCDNRRLRQPKNVTAVYRYAIGRCLHRLYMAAGALCLPFSFSSFLFLESDCQLPNYEIIIKSKCCQTIWIRSVWKHKKNQYLLSISVGLFHFERNRAFKGSASHFKVSQIVPQNNDLFSSLNRIVFVCFLTPFFFSKNYFIMPKTEYPCEHRKLGCPYVAGTNQNMKRHEANCKVGHPKEYKGALGCRFCEFRTEYRGSLSKHVKRAHEGNLSLRMYEISPK